MAVSSEDNLNDVRSSNLKILHLLSTVLGEVGLSEGFLYGGLGFWLWSRGGF